MNQEVSVRNAEEKDIDSVISLENEIWPEGTRATREKFESRLNIFPRGFFLAYKSGKLIGVSTSEIIKYNSENPPESWEAITDNGFIKNTHNPQGNALYVVSIGARSRSGGGTALIQAQKKLMEELSLRFLVLGARIPGYGEYYKNSEVPIEKYVELRRKNGQSLDPELRFYARNGLGLVKIVPNYMEDDRESRNYGAIMVWENPNFSS